jgi:DNA-binding winged helix-turn-helix (wHTH) protein
MELLIFLVGRRDQLVSRDDIVKKLWRSNLFIDTERNLNNVVRKIRTALGDNSGKADIIETVVGKGYRFIGPIRVIDAQYRRDDRELSGHSFAVESPSHWSQRASLLVLPPVLVGKATDDREYAWDLLTRWSRFSGISEMLMYSR